MIEAPKNCPCCNGDVEWKNDQLYCINPNCEAKQYKIVEHYAKTLKIKGLGPSTIEKLEVYEILDIYKLTIDEITNKLGSEKIAIKLYDEIERSKKQSLNNILPALGIPLIGKSATDKLSKVCTDIFDIDQSTCKTAGLGEKATYNILEALDTNDYYVDMPMELIFEQQQINTRSLGTICISGKLNSYPTKQVATDELERLGFIVKSSLTKDVTILVNESGKETQKTQKARESGILIVENLKNFIGEYN